MAEMQFFEWPDDWSQKVWRPTGTTCDVCKGPNPIWWVEDDIWYQVTATTGGSLCPTCFINLAQLKGIGRAGAWQLHQPATLR